MLLIVRDLLPLLLQRFTLDTELATFLDLLNKISENEMVERKEHVPVKVSQEALGLIVSCRGQNVGVALSLDCEFQPGPAG